MAVRWVRAVWGVMGVAFARALIAPTLGWAIPAAVVFGGNGMRAADLVSLFARSKAVWVAIVGGFAVLTAPALRAAATAKGLATLRSLRPPRGAIAVGLAVPFAAAQAPLFVLFACAGKWTLAVTHVPLAVGLELAMIALADRLAAHRSDRVAHARAPIVALAATHARTLTRRSAPAALLSAAMHAGAAGALWLSCANDPPRSPLGRAMCVLAGPLTAAAALLARPLVQAESAMRALLASTRARTATRIMAMLVVVSTPNAASAAAATYAATSHRASAGGAFVFGLAVAISVVAWARRHDRTRRPYPATFALGAFAIAAAATALGVVL